MIDYAYVVEELQKIFPQLVLCGSVALMLQGLLDRKNPGDIDFVLRENEIPIIRGLREDKYIGNDKYRSFHLDYIKCGKNYKLNLLVFVNATVINTEVVNYQGINLTMQKVDDILFWKRDYNRQKDRDDLDNVANNVIEKHYLS